MGKYYVVWRGRKPGIYSSWAECEAQVKAFPNARFKSFATKAEAEIAYVRGPAVVAKTAQGELWKSLPPNQQPKMQSLSVDSSRSGSTLVLEYRCIDNRSGQEVFSRNLGRFSAYVNNLGEYLALVEALQWCQQNQLLLPVYCDSRTAISWLRKNQVRTTLPNNAETKDLLAQVAAAEQWVKAYQPSNPVWPWDTERWGNISADYGRK